MSDLKDYDFIVGFTRKGFKTMYRHFDKLETAKLFASNVNIKNNCKIYVDLEYFEEIKTDLLLKLEMKKVLFVRKDKTTNKLLSELYIRKDELEKDYIPKSKVEEKIGELNKQLEEDLQDEIKVNSNRFIIICQCKSCLQELLGSEE